MSIAIFRKGDTMFWVVLIWGLFGLLVVALVAGAAMLKRMERRR